MVNRFCRWSHLCTGLPRLIFAYRSYSYEMCELFVRRCMVHVQYDDRAKERRSTPPKTAASLRTRSVASCMKGLACDLKTNNDYAL
jgi:hypothetical protein